jgi:hypothetical protein
MDTVDEVIHFLFNKFRVTLTLSTIIEKLRRRPFTGQLFTVFFHPLNYPFVQSQRKQSNYSPSEPNQGGSFDILSKGGILFLELMSVLVKNTTCVSQEVRVKKFCKYQTLSN